MSIDIWTDKEDVVHNTMEYYSAIKSTTYAKLINSGVVFYSFFSSTVLEYHVEGIR